MVNFVARSLASHFHYRRAQEDLCESDNLRPNANRTKETNGEQVSKCES